MNNRKDCPEQTFKQISDTFTKLIEWFKRRKKVFNKGLYSHTNKFKGK